MAVKEMQYETTSSGVMNVGELALPDVWSPVSRNGEFISGLC
jgi:hypothetical protein